MLELERKRAKGMKKGGKNAEERKSQVTESAEQTGAGDVAGLSHGSLCPDGAR